MGSRQAVRGGLGRRNLRPRSPVGAAGRSGSDTRSGRAGGFRLQRGSCLLWPGRSRAGAVIITHQVQDLAAAASDLNGHDAVTVAGNRDGGCGGCLFGRGRRRVGRPGWGGGPGHGWVLCSRDRDGRRGRSAGVGAGGVVRASEPFPQWADLAVGRAQPDTDRPAVRAVRLSGKEGDKTFRERARHGRGRFGCQPRGCPRDP